MVSKTGEAAPATRVVEQMAIHHAQAGATEIQGVAGLPDTTTVTLLRRRRPIRLQYAVRNAGRCAQAGRGTITGLLHLAFRASPQVEGHMRTSGCEEHGYPLSPQTRKRYASSGSRRDGSDDGHGVCA